MRPERPYQPIDCSLHDLLESAAILRRTVSIAYRVPSGATVDATTRIVDIVVRNGVELMKIEDGTEIRLDDVATVDGVPFR